MYSLKNILIIFLVILFSIILILLFVQYLKSTQEKFTTNIISIKPNGHKLYMNNFNNNMIIVSENNQNLMFYKDHEYLHINKTNLYLDFEFLNLYENLYIVRLYNSKNKVNNKWYFKSIKNNTYYIYQIIKKNNIYLHISDNVLKGDFQNKTAFLIHS